MGQASLEAADRVCGDLNRKVQGQESKDELQKFAMEQEENKTRKTKSIL